MKKIHFLSIALLTFAAACNDSTAPTPHSALTVKPPSTLVKGNTPPPPVGVSVVTCVDVTLCGAGTGTYFAQGTSVAATIAAADLADEALGWDGTAWLRFDNNQLPLQATVSANARVKNSSGNLSGTGTFTFTAYNGAQVVIKLTDVLSFVPNPSCTGAGEFCADITFLASVTASGVTTYGHVGRMVAFSSDFCSIDPNDPRDIRGCEFPYEG